jgi:hypothetical protein
MRETRRKLARWARRSNDTALHDMFAASLSRIAAAK